MRSSNQNNYFRHLVAPILVVAGLFLAVSGAQADDLKDLAGTWVRVMDGCYPLTQQEIDQLIDNGGNGLVRSMSMTIKNDSTFVATIMPSPRCQKNFQPLGVQSKDKSFYCHSATNEGEIQLEGRNAFTLRAIKSTSGANGWGLDYVNWQFERQEKILILRTRYLGCDGGVFHIYLLSSDLVSAV